MNKRATVRKRRLAARRQRNRRQAILGHVQHRGKKIVGEIAIGQSGGAQRMAFTVTTLKNGKTRMVLDSWHEKFDVKEWKRSDKRPKRRLKRSK